MVQTIIFGLDLMMNILQEHGSGQMVLRLVSIITQKVDTSLDVIILCMALCRVVENLFCFLCGLYISVTLLLWYGVVDMVSAKVGLHFIQIL